MVVTGLGKDFGIKWPRLVDDKLAKRPVLRFGLLSIVNLRVGLNLFTAERRHYGTTAKTREPVSSSRGKSTSATVEARRPMPCIHRSPVAYASELIGTKNTLAEVWFTSHPPRMRPHSSHKPGTARPPTAADGPMEATVPAVLHTVVSWTHQRRSKAPRAGSFQLSQWAPLINRPTPAKSMSRLLSVYSGTEVTFPTRPLMVGA
ncbi:uncharacterized protein CTRU02_208501 [Colletotrichum truncatum]|uniref:Uncharacterized protein n=1 Tax=Colletotrichum truncatum TaxID=5467 RepID=A0ACC3YWH3_COLTU|nr:uncharacterized protein CTRU02_10256 [Colletotrichum truncatum]KAF6787460.1 hypothetical protein CTRU02_10256 [Colletotrichum truncatum]